MTEQTRADWQKALDRAHQEDDFDLEAVILGAQWGLSTGRFSANAERVVENEDPHLLALAVCGYWYNSQDPNPLLGERKVGPTQGDVVRIIDALYSED